MEFLSQHIHTYFNEIFFFTNNSLQKQRVDESFEDEDDFEDDDLSDDTVPDEAFYYTEIEAEIETVENIKSPNPPSPPTLSHRDMARPPHEDPEYQRQLVGNMR